ncbi:MAG: S41 family peptidase [Acidobacteriota bacterium]
MTRRSNFAPLLLAGVLLVGAAVAGRFAIALIAHRYLSTALDLIQEHALNRGSVDWVTLRAQAHDRAVDALTRAQTYEAIRFVLDSLGDRQSGFLEPAAVAALTKAPAGASLPEGRLLPARIGLVRLRSFVNGDQRAIDRYATQLQDLIRNLDAAAPCGWIVDLRQNGGGNMWPMLAGVGPLLGIGKIGAFIDRQGAESSWFYSDGRTQEDVRTRARVIGLPYQVREQATPVAVLLGPATASSGEAVAVAFRQRPNTRTFGQRTRGLSTANELFRLNDGAAINLSVSIFADRRGHRYPDGVEPDEATPAAALDVIPPAAHAWLAGQPPCRHPI